MENNTLENTYENKNPLTRIYFRAKVNSAIKAARLKKGEVILDFGCGGGWLEKKLKNFGIKGYDINPEKTFIKDYRKIKPDKIFCLDVFEHIPADEIKRIIKNFKQMNNRFIIIVSIPTGNFISRKVRKLVGKSEVPKEHMTSYHEILNILKKNFRIIKKINFFSVTKIFVFRYRKHQSE